MITRCLCPRSAGVLPTALPRGDPRCKTFETLVQPLQEPMAIFPIHLLHRTIRTLETTRIGLLTHHGFPQRLGARRVEQPEARVDRLFMPSDLRQDRGLPRPPAIPSGTGRVGSSGDAERTGAGARAGARGRRPRTLPSPRGFFGGGGSMVNSAQRPYRSRPIAEAQRGRDYRPDRQRFQVR